MMGVVPMPGIVTTSQAEVEGTPIYMEDGILKIDEGAWEPTQVGQGDSGYPALVFPTDTTYKLTSDITTEYPICLGEYYGDGWHSDDITLDLNGYSITGNGSRTVINITGSESTYSKLTLKDSSNGDGSITGGGMSNGGGVCVNGGIFDMDGGTITGNNGSYGGGVCVENTGSFTMNGGTITGNTASEDGGGVYVDSSGTFTMKGGTITGNTAPDDGSGVYVDFSATEFSVSGNVSIIGNYKGTSESNRTTNNVYLEDAQNISFEGALNSNARIGVNTDSLRAFTVGLSGKGAASNFISDNDNYEVVLNDSNEAELRKHTLSSLSVSIGDWTYEDTPNSPSISGNAGGGDVSYVFYTNEDCADAHKTTGEDGATVDGGRPEYAGNYWLKTTVSETDAYYGKTVKTGFEIAQKVLPAPELDPDNPLIYNGSGQNLKDHLLNWNDDLMYFYENASGYTYSATDHSDADYMTRIDLTYPRNYVFDPSGDGTFYWNIEKATPTISNLTAGDITYGQKLGNSTLNGTAKGVDNNSLAGEFKWDDEDIKPSVSDSNTTAYNVTFTPNDSNNYETVSTTVKLKANPKSVTITGLTAINRK